MSNPLPAPSELTTTPKELGCVLRTLLAPVRITSVDYLSKVHLPVHSLYPGCARPLRVVHNGPRKRTNTLVND